RSTEWQKVVSPVISTSPSHGRGEVFPKRGEVKQQGRLIFLKNFALANSNLCKNKTNITWEKAPEHPSPLQNFIFTPAASSRPGLRDDR
ncbi:hypothetical protein, partial [Caldithrix abyssi]